MRLEVPRLAHEMLDPGWAVQQGDDGTSILDACSFEYAATGSVPEHDSMPLSLGEPQAFHVSFDRQIRHSVRLENGADKATDGAASRQDDMTAKAGLYAAAGAVVGRLIWMEGGT